MRKINYICRFIPSVIVTGIFGLIAYVLTVLAMIFIKWDLEFVSLKTVHIDIKNLFLKMLGMDVEVI
jgi:hypothetical protein